MHPQTKAVEQLMELEREAYCNLEKGDIDALIGILEENAWVCPPGIEAVQGKENQRKLFTELMKLEGVELWWEPREARTTPSEEMGYVLGEVHWRIPGEEKIIGKYVSIWVKQPDGKWLNAVEMRNANS